MQPSDASLTLSSWLAHLALPRVATTLDARIPTVLLGADGESLLYANASAASLFGLSHLRDRLGAPAPLDEAVLRQLKREIATLEAGTPRRARVRYYRGLKPIVLLLEIERLEASDGAPVFRLDLPELSPLGATPSLAATLALYAGADDFLTIFGDDDALAVAGRAEILDEAPAEIEALAERAGGANVEASMISVGADRQRPAFVVRLADHPQARRLLYIGPAEARPAALPAPIAIDPVPETAPASGPAPQHEPEISTGFHFTPTAKAQRFAWALDRERRFVTLGGELAATLGPHAAPLIGEAWDAVRDRLELDPDDLVVQHLRRRVAWHGLVVAWPVEGTDQRVSVELTGMPATASGDSRVGFSGFGVIRANQTTADVKATGLRLAPAHPIEAGSATPASLLQDNEPPASAEHPHEDSSKEPASDHPDEESRRFDVVLAALQAAAAHLSGEAPVVPPDEAGPRVETVAAAPSVAQHHADAEATHDVAVHDAMVEVAPEIGQAPDVERPVDHRADQTEEPIFLLGPTTHISPETLRLSGDERNAFRQIAEALGARFEGDEEPVIPVSTPVPGADRPDTVRILSTQDLLDELNRAHPTEPPKAGPIGTASIGRLPVPAEREARLVDRLPIAVGLTRDEAFIHVNSAFLALTGFDSLDDLNRAGGLDVLFAGPHASRTWGEERPRRHIPLVTRQGRVIPVDARIASVPWGNGTALLITLVSGDRPGAVAEDDAPRGPEATDREHDRRVALLEAIVAQASDGVLMLDADGRVQSANAAAEALFGYPPGQLSGRPFADLMSLHDRRAALDYLDGLARNGIGSLLLDGRELTAETAADRRLALHVVIGRMPEGAGSAYCATLRDISRWKTSEEELTTAKRRAEEASVQKSDFLARISHEIRTPLNAIIGFSEVMLSERLGAIGVERYKDYLRDIQSSGTHIMSLVNDLLDLSKVEAGKLELKFEAVHLVDILAECVHLMQPQANRERIIIRASLTQGLPPVVADIRSIRQIVLNLLSNAIKFTPPGGQVIVSAAYEDAHDVVVRVRDTGYGMSPSEVETALEPFRQIHNGRGRDTGPGSGTGLGLPLTKALVEANRATLKIDSAVNQGTLVQITFPSPLVLAAE